MEHINLSDDSMALFRPPTHKLINSTFDRALFSRTIPLAAARVFDKTNISYFQTQLDKSKELLRLDRLKAIQPDNDFTRATKGGRCLLLQPRIKNDDPTNWSSIISTAVSEKTLEIIPYDLFLGYNYWTYLDIMKAILPDEYHDEIPVGFSIAGHVAHLNLREQYLPFKHIIATVLVDKNPVVKTVINKIDNVGTSSTFRTFDYEVLYGPDDLDVKVSEGDCIFRFNYAKVYWNSRLQTEHKRLVSLFNPGDFVVDVMAGVGPFAIPATKKKAYVWANDLNPESYRCLEDNVKLNKVEKFIHSTCEDGNAIIRKAADEMLLWSKTGGLEIVLDKVKRRHEKSSEENEIRPVIKVSKTVTHYVMNLPATAIEFLPSFSGLYSGHEALFEPHTNTKLPLIHVYCFSTKSDHHINEARDILARIQKQLSINEGVLRCEADIGEGWKGPLDTSTIKYAPKDGDVRIHHARDVAPNKSYYCATFRLPSIVAFRRQ